MEENTREFPTIADAPGYADLIKESHDSLRATSSDPPPEENTEVEFSKGSFGGRKTPLYSILKHYPTKWEVKLREEWRNQQQQV
jgi:hypothetical protein